MANVFFFFSLLVVLMLIWFDNQKKRENGKKPKRLNQINVVRKPKTEQVCGLLNGSHESANATYTNKTTTYFDDQPGEKTIEKIDLIKPANQPLNKSLEKPLDKPLEKPFNKSLNMSLNESNQKINKTETKLAKNETEQNATQSIVNQTNKPDQKPKKQPGKSRRNQKTAKFSFILIRLLYKYIQKLIWLILRFLYLAFLAICRLISILRSMKNSFLSKLAAFYLTVLSFLGVLALCTAASLKQPTSLARLAHHIVQLHLQILRATTDVLKTCLTFLLLLVAFVYPEKHKFETSNHFNHLKLISTSLIQTMLVYLSKLLGYSVFYLTKFEIYFNYVQAYIDLAFPSTAEFR